MQNFQKILTALQEKFMFKHVRCELGHNYDKSLYGYCPVCKAIEEEKTRLRAEAAAQAAIENTPPQIIKDPIAVNTEQNTNQTRLLNPKQNIIIQSQLTVGWLVIVETEPKENIGKSFTLIAGQNRIGRNHNMDIALEHDSSVTGEDHAKLIYDGQTNRFMLWHDKGRNLTYVNNQLVKEHTLNPYDRIQIGQTYLLFVPFCGEQFQW